MSRPLTDLMATEVAGAKLSPLLLIKFQFDAGDVNIWTGIGDLLFAGDTYLGLGDLLSITTVQETQTIKAAGIEYTISGLPPDAIAIALGEDFQGRKVRMWFGALNSSGVLISAPVLILVSRMDIMQIGNTAATVSITISAENVLIALTRVNDRRYTPEDQAIDFPSDKGLDFVDSLQDKEVVFGNA